jgi:hypothetical protein
MRCFLPGQSCTEDVKFVDAGMGQQGSEWADGGHAPHPPAHEAPAARQRTMPA